MNTDVDYAVRSVRAKDLTPAPSSRYNGGTLCNGSAFASYIERGNAPHGRAYG